MLTRKGTLPGTQAHEIMGMYGPETLPVMTKLVRSDAVCDRVLFRADVMVAQVGALPSATPAKWSGSTELGPNGCLSQSAQLRPRTTRVGNRCIAASR